MNISNLLKRTNLKIPFDQFIEVINQNYPTIGKIQDYTPIFEGYEDANIILKTDTGKYALKIFLNERSEKNIADYAKVIRQATNVGVGTMEIIPSNQGDICKFNDVSFMITKFFDGKDFQGTTPTIDEMLLVTQNIAKLNTLDFEIDETYDSWGNKNLIKEYEKTTVKNDQILDAILPLVTFLKAQKLTAFSRAVIHGDMQRKHVLKDGNKFCIIDFGCMSYDLKVYDLSTLLAWFCLANDTWNQRNEIYEKVITEYTKLHKLSDDEISMVKPLIAASYAAYLLKTTELIENGDDSAETRDWNLSSKEMFEKCIKWLDL